MNEKAESYTPPPPELTASFRKIFGETITTAVTARFQDILTTWERVRDTSLKSRSKEDETQTTGVRALHEFRNLAWEIFQQDVLPNIQEYQGFTAEKIRKAALEHYLKADSPEEMYQLYSIASAYQDTFRMTVLTWLNTISPEEIPFSDFDKILLEQSLVIAHYYDQYFRHWHEQVNHSPAARLLGELKYDALPPEIEEGVNHLYLIPMFYTESAQPEDIRFLPPYQLFQSQLSPIIATMKATAAVLEEVADPSNEYHKLIIRYLRTYAQALAASDEKQLTELFSQLDEMLLLMGKYHLILTHDFETYNGGPFDTKALPDFSLRIRRSDTEEIRTKEAQFEAIHSTIKEYTTDFLSSLSQKGMLPQEEYEELFTQFITALDNTSTAFVFHIPSGMSLSFKWAAQSLPNNPNVRMHGTLEHIDLPTIRERIKITDSLAKKIYANPEELDPLEFTGFIHAHETGHVPLSLLKLLPNTEYPQTLEELRANMMALMALYNSYVSHVFSEGASQRMLKFFYQDILRILSQRDIPALAPYLLSARYFLKIAEEERFIGIDKNSGKLLFRMENWQRVYQRVIDDLKKLHIAAVTKNSDDLKKLFIDYTREPNSLEQRIIELLPDS